MHSLNQLGYELSELYRSTLKVTSDVDIRLFKEWVKQSRAQIIKQRLDNYTKMSLPIKSYYGNNIVDIDGEGTIDEVYKLVVDTLFETYKEPRDINEII